MKATIILMLIVVTTVMARGGTLFYQGDIVLDQKVNRFIYPEVKHTRYKRETVRSENRLWPDGVVPYSFALSLSPAAKEMILKAFRHIQNRTCITFREKGQGDNDFILFDSELGCWSSVGRKGGRQLISLGQGCEDIGTAVHEITHALGVWHEQERSDRDKYVKIQRENVLPDEFKANFEKVNSSEATSRGYPYDYASVMQYSGYDFTRNGKPTIKVIGLGEKLGVTLGQRTGLSTIDTAQLRDMYRCNLRLDTNQTECPKDWVKHETECYKFFNFPKEQLSAASKQCGELNSHLVFIESKREDEFIADYLLQNFPYEYTWRTGGKEVNGTMMWYREGSDPKQMDYTNWGKDQPSNYTTTALYREPASNRTEWLGVWEGSINQLPFYMYPFICERRAKRSCLRLRYKDGRDYRGKLDHTMDGNTCQKWTENYPHEHNKTTPKVTATSNGDDDSDRDSTSEDADGLGDHNFCRNPQKERRSRPWCYTTKTNKEWQFCDVSACRIATRPTTPETHHDISAQRRTQDRPQQTSSNSGRHGQTQSNSRPRLTPASGVRLTPSKSGAQHVRPFQTSSNSGREQVTQLPNSYTMRELSSANSRQNQRQRQARGSTQRREGSRRTRNTKKWRQKSDRGRKNQNSQGRKATQRRQG